MNLEKIRENQSIWIFSMVSLKKKRKLKNIDSSHEGIREAIFGLCRQFLVSYGIEFDIKNKEAMRWRFYGSMYPNWLQVDILFLDSIIKTAPENLNENQIIRYVKKRIKEVFVTRHNKYPKWLQNPEWPIIVGKAT